MITSQAEAEVPRPELARRVVRDARLSTGFRLLLRAALALPMIGSGIARLIPVQMPPLRPLDLLQRLGEWTQGELLRVLIGASPVFQSFTGLAALLGGVQMAGGLKRYELALDMEKKRMKLGPSQEIFSFQQPEKDVLILDGQLEGRRLRAKLRKVPLIRRTT